MTIEVTDVAGQAHRVTRDGPGALHTNAPGPPKQVVLDPDRRLVELTHEPGKGPRYNNRLLPKMALLA
ncbi:MAG: hypothetical protein R3C68_07890 [Myxococcota bacterium]